MGARCSKIVPRKGEQRKEIVLYNNLIRENETYLVDIGLKNAQEVVRYCQEKVKKNM